MERQRAKIFHLVEATQVGVRKHVVGLLGHLNISKYDLTLGYATRRADTPFFDALPGLRARGVRLIEIDMLRRIAPVRDGLGLLALVRLLRHGEYDIIHTHSAKAGFLGRLAAHIANVPIRIHTPNAWSFLAPSTPLLATAYRQLERIAAGWTDVIIAVSQTEVELAEKFNIAPASKTVHIPNGIVQSTIVNGPAARDEIRSRWGASPSTIVIGSVLRFTWQKDPLGLIAALAPLLRTAPRCILVLVGDGPLRQRAEALTHTLGVARQTIFAGFRTDATELLFGFDVFLLPSRYEGLSYALLEAMAAGLAVITSSGGGEDAITDGENGFVIPPGDATQLRKATERLIADRGLREDMGQRNRQKVLQFSVTEQVRRTETLYDRLLEQKTRAHLNHHL